MRIYCDVRYVDWQVVVEHGTLPVTEIFDELKDDHSINYGQVDLEKMVDGKSAVKKRIV